MTAARARSMTGARNGFRYWLCGLGLLLALLTASCGNNDFIVGTPIITMTAKPGRFATYIVTIDEIELTRKDGSVIELPAINQRVDLANLGNVFNLLTAPAVGVGTYVSATILLDYSAAIVNVNDAGGAFQTTLNDAVTKTLPTTETIFVQFDPENPLVINSQNSAVLNFDIDLEASNIIGANTGGNFAVTVKPFFNVTATPTYDKPVFARGLYVLTDPNKNNFVMNLRPLHDVIDAGMGALTANIDANTIFFINGTNYTGPAGLAALGKLQNLYADLQIAVYGPPSGNPFGDLDKITPSIAATQVYVGSSFESTIEDQATGFVSAISGNTLHVHGAAYVDRIGDFSYAQDLPVTVGPNTLVRTDGDVNVSSVTAISVGQTVTVLGVGTVDATSGVPTALDATGGTVTGNLIRVQDTTLIGTVNSSTTNSLSLSLLDINHYAPAFIDFTGTGSGGNDATVANYTISSPTVDASQYAPGTVVKVTGKTTAFGQGPPYFTADAINGALEQQLIIEWAPSASTVGALNPFSVVNGSGIAVNLNDAAFTTAGSGSSVVVKTGPLTTYDVLASPSPQLSGLPAGVMGISFNTTDPNHLFGVGSDTVGEFMDTQAQDFANHVLIVNDGTLPIHKLVAYGQYDPTTRYFNATRITINSQ